MSDNALLIKACKELAIESYEWLRIQTDYTNQGKHISWEELRKLTENGAWKRYLIAGGSRTMINTQLSRDDDFQGQYEQLIKNFSVEL